MSRTSFLAVGGLLAIVACLPLMGLGAQPEKAKGKKIALLVGVNDYQNRNFDDLQYAEADVKTLSGVLRGAGFEVRLLLGSGAGKDEATRENIQTAFAELLKGVGKSDTVLLAFSGHGKQLVVDTPGPDGTKVRKETPFFCPKDALPTDPDSLVSLSGIIKTLDERGGGHNLLLVDACRDVVDPNKGSRGGIDSSRVENLGEGTAVFLACSSRQKARETEKAGGGHGVFLHFVVEGLRGEAQNEKGDVTWESLVPYVKRKVKDDFPGWFPKVKPEERQQPISLGNIGDDPVLTTAVIDLDPDTAKRIKAIGGRITWEGHADDFGVTSLDKPTPEEVSATRSRVPRAQFYPAVYIDAGTDQTQFPTVATPCVVTFSPSKANALTDTDLMLLSKFDLPIAVNIMTFSKDEVDIAITSKGIAAISKYKTVQNLSISMNTLEDSHLEQLAKSSELRTIRIHSDSKSVTPDGLEQLTKLSKLRFATLHFKHIDEAKMKSVVSKLEAAIPRCTVTVY